MKYSKKPLTFEEQADQLIGRGLLADRSELISKLKDVNYCRLSAYFQPFYIVEKDKCLFKEGTKFKFVWQNYTFDRKLRLIVLDAIERFEISLRTKMVYEFSHRCGPFSYMDKTYLPNIDDTRFDDWINKIKTEENKCQDDFLKNFKTAYQETSDLPIWILVELMTFGELLTFFKGINDTIKKIVASQYSLTDVVLNSWILTLSTVRNTCAHHSRLWDKSLRLKPFIPKNDNKWKVPVLITNNRIFCILSMLSYLVKIIAPQSHWKERLFTLLEDYPDLDKSQMGFPANWKESPLWK